jgi:hypothetical protein
MEGANVNKFRQYDLWAAPEGGAREVLNLFKVVPEPDDDDSELRRDIASWHVARLRAQLAWAEAELEQQKTGTWCGASETAKPFKEEMNRCEIEISKSAINTTMAALETLTMAMTILTARELDDGCPFGQGPTTRLLLMVHNFLNTPGEHFRT